jgi:hypothetical protein
MQFRFAAALETLLQNLLVPDAPSLQLPKRMNVRYSQYRASHHEKLDARSVFYHAGSYLTECGPLGRNDGAFRLGKLGWEKPKGAVIDEELAAVLPAAAFVQNGDSLASPQRVNDWDPFPKCGFGTHLHDAKAI